MRRAEGYFAGTALSVLGRTVLAAGLAAAAALCPAGPAGANDSTASLDAGGLRLTFNPDIRVETEDLTLSRAEVRVVYRFRNTGSHDIRTLVAFPLPAIEIGEGANYALDGRDPVNVMDFRVTVDGKPIAPAVEVRATRFGVDVTKLLGRYNIPPTMVSGERSGGALFERLNNLPAKARSELERYGVIDWNTSFGAHQKPLANAHWKTHLAFYWFQIFPAGRTIEVTHRYRPVPRQFFFAAEDLVSAATQKAYCIDPAFARAARARIAQAPQRLLAGYELKYVLTTAANWMGPIGKFRLAVEKSSPAALVALCADGIKRTGPASYALSRENYRPSEDLRVLFVEPLRGEE